MTNLTHREDGEIDWQELRGRIDQAFISLRGTAQERAARVRSILDARARHLARPAVAARESASRIEVLPFSLGRERYCLETRFAREVVRLTDYSTLPETPDFLLGVTNLRGEILPIFDLMLFFGFASQGLMDRSRIIVVGEDRAEFGIIADTVHEISSLSLEDLPKDAVFEGRRGRQCARGITRDAVIVLDGERLVSEAHLFIGASNDGGS